MSDSTKLVVVLKKMLMLLNNSKLEYIKASDESNHPKVKRYLNLQSTIRNRYFQEVTKVLRSLNVEVENLVIHRLNFEEMVISSIKKPNHSHLQKCIQYDQKLLVLHDEAIALNHVTSGLKVQRNKISEAVSESTYFLESAGFILEP